jgi:hypothetical protein
MKGGRQESRGGSLGMPPGWLHRCGEMTMRRRRRRIKMRMRGK